MPYITISTVFSHRIGDTIDWDNFSDLNTDYNVLDIRDNETTRNLNLSNIFIFNQDVNAYYTQFGKKINKFSYLLGLRAETTNLQFNQKTSQ